MEYCFVIQPFDKKYDKRYFETFEPAIKNAGLNAYRVDNDQGVRIPIITIENKIKKSRICFAEITTNNPNVWYELGFANACNKDVVMVSCEEGRKKKYPFDIQHKHVIKYSANSKSDFQELETKITAKLKALLLSKQENQILLSIFEINQFSPDEREVISLLIENIFLTNAFLSFSIIEEKTKEKGVNSLALRLAIKTLTMKGIIEAKGIEPDNNCFGLILDEHSYKFTEIGERFVIENQKMLSDNS
jgi:hypothetical protein